MLSKISVLAGFVLSAALFAQADVTPSEPGPGSTFNAGATCTVSWIGDKESTTAWKNMAIQLMSGSNTDMNHITTIASDQDGTVDGRVNYPCPEVNPYATIYFYQFTAPGAPDKTWTTRFTIASSTGQSVPAVNQRQPDGQNIPWGVGALVNPGSAVPPPASAGGSDAGAAGNTTATSTTSSAASSSTASSSSRSLSASRISSSGAASPTGNGTANLKVGESGARVVGAGSAMVLAVASSVFAIALSL